MSGIPGICCFFDDILIVGSTEAEHNARVRQVLQRLKQRGVRLKKDKCEFGQSEVTYLGHRVDHEGLKPTEDKVKAIREAPEPRNVTELKAFLGLLNCYNHSYQICPILYKRCMSYFKKETVEMDKETQGRIQCSREQVITVWFSYAL